MSLRDYVLETAWALRPETLEQLVQVLNRHEANVRLTEQELQALERPAASTGSVHAEAAERGYALRGSVAVIPIGGVISKYSSMVQRLSGGRGTSVVGLRKALAAARQDEAVASILLLIDSPGGSVAGVETLAQDIRRTIDSGKPVVAFADDLMASAAYWLGSQAVEVYASRTAAVGSIGVYSIVYDTSRAYENAGYKVHLVKAGQHKGTGADGVPVTAENLRTLGDEVQAYYDAFVEAVARGRDGKLTADQVRELADGRVHIGPKAKELGLIDGVSSAEEVLARMERRYGKSMRSAHAAAAQPVGAAAMKNDGVNITGDQDKGGAAAVAAAAGGTEGVDVQAVVQQAVAGALAEQGRQAKLRAEQISAATAGFEHLEGVVQLKAQALADPTMSVATVQDKVLQIAREQLKPTGAGSVEVGTSGRERLMAGMEAVLLVRANGSILDRMRGGGEAAKRTADLLGLDDPQQFVRAYREAEAGGLRRLRLRDMAERLTDMRGVRTDDDLVRATFAHSTSDFPDLLKAVANKLLLASFAEERTTYQLWCRIGSASDFKEMPMITLSEAQNLLEIAEGKPAEEGTLNQRAESIKLRTFGRRISFGRQALINDDLSAFALVPQMIGAAAARVPEDLAYLALNNAATTTMSDGTAFFHASRGNLLAGAALSVASLEAAITAMQLQRGFGKDKAELEIQPKYLLVPTGLQFTARQIVNSPVKPGGTNDEPNPVRGLVEPVASSRLHRASATAWYLTADPMLYPAVQVNFLNGQREPIITEVGDGSILGLTYEVIFDCGAALVQPEAATRNPGA